MLSAVRVDGSKVFWLEVIDFIFESYNDYVGEIESLKSNY